MEIQQLKFLKHFFRRKRHVYLDNNATTAVSHNVRRTMNQVLKNCYGNPSSLYSIARKSNGIIEDARQHVAAAINADPGEIYFTGCATESNNAVLKSLSNYFYPKKKKIISTAIEHSSVINTLVFLSTQGIVVEFCPVDRQGRVVLTELEKLIDDDTFLVCCMLANNELGTIQDIAAITKIARPRDVLVMSDCVQAFGKIPIDVHGLGIDYASFSAHKLYGPKGVGALYVKQGSPFVPFIHGGHQENGMRAGTESLHNIAGFGSACQVITMHLSKSEQISALKSMLIQKLREIKLDCVINSPETDCLPNTVSISFPNVSNGGLMAVFDNHGIAVSAGSACNSHDDKPSNILKTVGLSDQAAKETIRFSLSCTTSLQDIIYTTQVFKNYIEGRTLLVNLITSAQLNEELLFDEKTFILDVRPQFMRNILKSLPNSHEVSFVSIEKYLYQIPKDKDIIVACQRGELSYIVAYYLLSQGYRRISSLHGGVCGWKTRQSELYQKFAGQNIQVLKPSRKKQN